MTDQSGERDLGQTDVGGGGGGGWLLNKHQRRCTNAVLMLSQRLKRWPNIKTALVHCLVFAGCPVVGVILSGIHSHPHSPSLSLGGPRDAVCLPVNKMNIKTTTLFTSVVHSPETAINYIIIGGVEHERSCRLSIIIKFPDFVITSSALAWLLLSTSRHTQNVFYAIRLFCYEILKQ